MPPTIVKYAKEHFDELAAFVAQHAVPIQPGSPQLQSQSPLPILPRLCKEAVAFTDFALSLAETCRTCCKTDTEAGNVEAFLVEYALFKTQLESGDVTVIRTLVQQHDLAPGRVELAGLLAASVGFGIHGSGA